MEPGTAGEEGLGSWRRREKVCARAPGPLAEEDGLLVRLIEVIFAATFRIVIKFSYQPLTVSLMPALFHCTETAL